MFPPSFRLAILLMVCLMSSCSAPHRHVQVPVKKQGAGLGLFKDCSVCPLMVKIPAGRYQKGPTEAEYGRAHQEGPQHEVTIPRPFAVGRYEVTFAEWDACAADGGCLGYRPADEGWGRGQQPVINVSWDDAQGYVQWLSRKTGKTYRLLSEAEWEYVARAGTSTPFWMGHCVTTAQANYDGHVRYRRLDEAGDLVPCTGSGMFRQQTVPVGSFPPNAFGLHEVHGNVREWIQDCEGYPQNGAEPMDQSGHQSVAANGDCLRGGRGGGWSDPPAYVRSAAREFLPADERHATLGVRIARDLHEE